jgi:RHS repeat-associated protein
VLLVLLVFLLLGLAGAASATAGSDYPSTVLGDTPSAYWRLGEASGTTFADSSGNGNPLTLTAPTSPNGVAGTSDAPGDVSPDDGGYQFNFDNSNLYVGVNGAQDTDANGLLLAPHMQATMSSGYPAGTNSYALEAWVKPTAESSSAVAVPEQIIGNYWSLSCGAGQPANEGTRLYYLQAYGNTEGSFVFERSSGCTGSQTTRLASVPVTPGQWYYVVATYDGLTMRLYVDHTLVTEQPVSSFSIGSVSNDHTINVGNGLGSVYSSQRADVSGEHFKGTIDEAAAYSYALAGSQVQAHYAYGLSSANSYSNPPAIPTNPAPVTLPALPNNHYAQCGGSFLPTEWQGNQFTVEDYHYYTDEGWTLEESGGPFQTGDAGAGIVGSGGVSSPFFVGWYPVSDLGFGGLPEASLGLDGGYISYSVAGSNNCGYSNIGAAITVNFKWVYFPPLAQENGCNAAPDGVNDASFFGDVNSLSGAYATSITDVKMPSLGVPLTFTRCYSSAFSNVSGPLGPGWKDSFSANLTFDDAGDAIFTSESGQGITYYKNADGSYTAPDGYSTLTQLGDGTYRLTRVSGTSYHFDANGNPLSETDRNGEGLTFSYSGGKLTTITDQTGRTATLAYTGNLLSSVTYSDGRGVGFGYTGGLLTSFTDVRGKVWHYTYDSGNRLASIQDPLGHYSIRNTYDSSTGRVTSQEDAGNQTRTINVGTGGTTTVTDPNNKVWTDTYQNNELVSRKDPLGDTYTYTYDDQGNRLTSTDPNGHTTTYTYDANGNMLSEAAPASLNYQAQTWTYNSLNEVTSHTDARGHETDDHYDAAGNLTSIVKPGNLTTTYNRNASNPELVDSMVNARNKTTHYTYDANGNLASVTDPDGNETTYTYDSAGDKLTITSPRGNVAGCGCAPQYTTTYTYNNAGHKLSATDPLGNETTYSYDDAGNLASMVDPLGNAPGGNPANHTTTYAYNNANELTGVTRPGSQPSAIGYDTRGLVTSRTSPLGRQTIYNYDAAGRLTSVVSPNGNVTGCNCASQYTTTYSYDANGNRTKLTNPLGGVTDYAYDPLNRVVQKTVELASGNRVTHYLFDANGNLVRTIDPMGRVTTHSYDANNQLTGTTHVATTPPAPTFIANASANSGGSATSLSVTVPTTAQSGDLLIAALALTGDNNTVTAPSGWTVQTAANYVSTNNLFVITHYVQAGDPTSASFSWTTSAYAALALVDYRGASGANPPFDVNAYQVGATTTPTGQLTVSGNEVVLPIFYFQGSSNGGSPAPGTVNRATASIGEEVDIDSATQATAGSVPQYTPSASASIAAIVSIAGPTPSSPGPTTSYSYDNDGNLTSTTDPKGGETTYSYDDADMPTSSVSPLGNVTGCGCASQYTTSYGNDPDGNQHTVTDPLNRTTTTNYNADEQPINSTDPAGRETQWQYDANGNLTATIANDNATVKYAYNALNQLTNKTSRMTSPSCGCGNTTNYYPDNDGLLTKVVDPLGDTTTYTHDADGNRLTSEDAIANAAQNPALGTTTTTYNALDEPTQTSYSDGTHTVSYSYDSQGDPLSRTDSTGVTNYGYNADNQVTSAQTGSNSFSYGYDSLGELNSETYPNSTQISYGYDDNGNPNLLSSSSQTTSYVYDANNQLTSETMPNGYTATMTYTNAGQLASLTNAKAGTTLSSYTVAARYNDGAPQTLNATNNGQSWIENYTYDQDGRLASVCYQTSCPNGSDPKIAWGYDASGNRTSETRANAVSTAYTYNAADELQTAVKTTGQPGVNPYPSTVQSDGAQPYWRFGETSGSSFASTVGSFPGTWTGSPTLNVTGGLNGDSNGAVKLNGSSQYGTVSNSTTLGKTNNFTVELWIKRGGGTGSLQAIAGKPLTTTTKSENYAIWLTTGNKVEFQVGAGNKSQTLDSSGTITDTTNWHYIVATFASGVMKLYVDNGTPTSVTAAFTTASTNSSTFDVGRAGTANYFNGTIDELALYPSVLGSTQVNTHYTQATTTPPPQTVTTNYIYNRDGEETAAGNASYSWNLAGEMTTGTIGGPTTNYTYDGAGMRTSAVTGGSTINYTWDEAAGGLPTLASETDGSGNPLRTYLYGASSSPVSMTTPGGTYYDSYDAYGNVADQTNANGATQWAYSYEPFGLVRTATNVSGNAPTNPYQYAGQYTDAVTGLSDMRARNYDPNAGSFLTIDPAGQSTTMASNQYAYTGDSPLVYSDPSGLCIVQIACSAYDAVVHYGGEALYYVGEAEVAGAEAIAAGFEAAANGFNNYVVQPTIQAVQNDVSCLSNAAGGSFAARACISGAIGTAMFLIPEARGFAALTDIAGGLAFRAAARAAGTEFGQSATSSLFRLATEESGSAALGALKGGTEDASANLAAAGEGLSTADTSAGTLSHSLAADNPAQLASGLGTSEVPAATASSDGGSALEDAAQSCSLNSFTARTRVLLANGRQIPISKVKPGMKVLATDPTTDTTAARRVDAVIVHSGEHTMVDLTFADGSKITATDHHPFWDASTSHFTYAINLRAGEQVRETDGHLLTVSKTHTYSADLTAYNLTIDGTHTYYAGTTPVLVHNSCAVEAGESTAANAPQYSSSSLRANMEAVGQFGEGLQAHHIVPGGSYGGNANLVAARAILDRFGVGLDDAANGTYLPAGWHQSVHTLNYFQALNDALSGVGSHEDVLGVLRTFATELQDNLTLSPQTGNLPW